MYINYITARTVLEIIEKYLPNAGTSFICIYVFLR